MSKNTYFLGHPGRQGDFAELRFMARATEMGFGVTKPWGTNSRYDFVVEDRKRFSRIQVKSSFYRVGRRYICNARSPRNPYRHGEIDFIAIYLIQEDLWYIIPSTELKRSASFSITPTLAGHRYERYKEAWWLLEGSERDMPTRRRKLVHKNAGAVTLGSQGKREGGEACAGNLTVWTRTAIARHAALCRWRAKSKRGKGTTE